VEGRMTADAYSLHSCLHDVQRDNRAPIVAIGVSAMSALTVYFQVAASDEDGRIVRHWWNFGDGGMSFEQAPSHAYTTPGWYLVSCTVTEDDGVSVTDWQYLRVPKGNVDGDGDVDLDDYAKFPECATGPAGSLAIQDCAIFDADGDDHVDLSDFADIQALFTGSTG